MAYFARIAAVLAVSGAIALDARTQPAPVDVVGLIDTYYQGRHDEAIAKAAALPDLGSLRLRFVQDTPGWIAADPANAATRRAAVAGFIVELAAARLESDWGRLSDLIEWTCALVLRAGGPPTPFERSWHLATTALAGRARTRVWLLGPYARLPHQKPRTPRPEDPPSPKHLMHAIERFPEEPHFQLARVVAWTWGRDGEPIRNARMRVGGDRELQAGAPQMEAITAFEPLLAVPALAAETHIRIGLIQVTVRNHGAALRSFEAAQPIAGETPLKYLSHFLAGRSLEALNRHEDAMRQYRRALEILPSAESATVALASLQFLHNERDASVALVDKTFAAPTTSTDPGRLIGYGDYLRWPQIKAAMRAELK
jgi:hypothetical protein